MGVSHKKDSEVVVVRCFSIRLRLANLRHDQNTENSKTSIESNHAAALRSRQLLSRPVARGTNLRAQSTGLQTI
jgi:hypothetical protein